MAIPIDKETLVQAPDGSWWLAYPDHTIRAADQLGNPTGPVEPWRPDVDAALLDPTEIAYQQELEASAFTKTSAASTSESEMRAVTDSIILWCQDASAYLFGPRDQNGIPLYGSLSIPTILALLQNGETAILNYKASESKPDALVRQYEWLIARSVQANTLMNVAALSR